MILTWDNVKMLLATMGGELTANQVANTCGVSFQKASQLLVIMHDAGELSRHRVGAGSGGAFLYKLKT